MIPKQVNQGAGEIPPPSAPLRRTTLFARNCLLACVLAGAFCAAAFAQSEPEPTVAPASELVSELERASGSAAVLPEEPYPMPDAATLPLQPGDSGFVPLRGKERTNLFLKEYLASPVTYVEIIGSGTLDWIAGEPEGWNRGFSGYSQRVGNEFVWYTTEEAVHEAGDAALGLDPRYFPCRCSSFLHRLGNGFKMTLFAYDGSGRIRLDLPRFVGAYGSSMLVTTWYPAGYSPLKQGVTLGHIELGLDAAANLMHEFTPELKRFFRHLRP